MDKEKLLIKHKAIMDILDKHTDMIIDFFAAADEYYEFNKDHDAVVELITGLIDEQEDRLYKKMTAKHSKVQ